MTMEQVANPMLGASLARNNLFTNGGLEIWQRGTTFNATNGAFTADRWRSDIQGGSGEAVNVTQITSTIGTPGLSAQLAYTHGTGTIQFMNWNEPALLKALKGLTISVAFTVKSTVAGTVKPVFRSWSGGVTQYGNANVGTGSERLTVTTALPANDPATGGILTGLELGVASCTVELNDATMVVGSTPADYIPPHPADDLARCLRYYERIGGDNSYSYAGWSQAASYVHYVSVPYKAMKAATPTVTNVAALLVNCASFTIDQQGKDAFRYNITTNVATQVWLVHTNSQVVPGTAYFTVESNP